MANVTVYTISAEALSSRDRDLSQRECHSWEKNVERIRSPQELMAIGIMSRR